MSTAVGRDLVRRWRAGTGHTARPTGSVAVSAVQRGILVFERLRPSTAVFNLCFAARHTGPLEEARFDGALTALVRRHPALRCTFNYTDDLDGPTCSLKAPDPVATQWTDLRHLPPHDRAGAACEQAERDVAEPFDLKNGPLIRVHGYRLGENDRLLAFAGHHLICDGPSVNVLLSELDVAYRGNLTGELPFIEPEPTSAPALAYWREQLAGLPNLDLPTDQTPRVGPGFRARSVPLDISPDLVNAIDELAQAENATTFMVVLAAFQLLLGEQTGQHDFAIGSPHVGRTRPGEQGAVGLLSDLLVLRSDLSGRPTFRDLVRRTRRTCLDAFAHRAAPFEELVAALAPGRHVAGALVRATLAYHGERQSATLAGAPLAPVSLSRPAVRHDVELHLWREGRHLRGSWDYDAGAFTSASALRMARRLPVLLARALAEPNRPVGELDLLTRDERVLLEDWSTGPLPEIPDVSLIELFAMQTQRTPDALAVCDGQHELTYRRLNERANQLAHHLRAAGAGSGDVVGIKLSRTVDLIVAMLGVLKTGAAYLPLDPAYPAERNAYMLRDSGARSIVTAADLHAAASYPTSAPSVSIDPAQTAWVLYTSGSTGRPKGVLVTHRNAGAMVLWGADEFTPTQLARVLFSTSACFDVSAFEIYVPLCSGGAVVVVENALALLAETPKVTMICSIPSAMRALLDADAVPRSVRALGLGGEAVTDTIADDLYAIGHIEIVADLYGPTEDTTYSAHARLRPGEQPPPIGELLPHGRGYVLNQALRRVPIGAVGELYLAGRGLTTGYLGQPDLTAGHYIADPFAAEPGLRMYRTGDLVRYRADGALLYLGRSDQQVKVRGARIELGEIESALRRHPEVRDAVVALTGERLVAYVTARTTGKLDLDDVRVTTQHALPSVMVPSVVVLIDTIPLTPNGKVDRSLLPEPQQQQSTGRGRPRGHTEELIARVWRTVLRRDDIARDDDFFDLGGDSLLAGKVLTGLRRATGADVGLSSIFEHTRLADLAAALSTMGAAPSGSAVVTARDPDATPLLSFEQRRVWLESMLKPATAYNVHGRWALHGTLDVAVLRHSINAIANRHETLRTSFPLLDGLPVPRVADRHPGSSLRVGDVSTAPNPTAEASALADEQAKTTFDLASGPLFDCLLIRQSDDEHLLTVTIHHIISDGWSIGLFVRELSELYAAGGDTDRARLATLPVQYLDYAAWQRERLGADHLAAQVKAWRKRMAGAPPALNLPLTRRRAPAHGAVGGRVGVTLDAPTTSALHRVSREYDGTPFMAILAALVVVLRRWSGQDDIVVGVPVDTRGESGVDTVIGFFVNTVPVRVPLRGDASFTDVLRTARTACLDSYGVHGGTPFDVLVRELHPVRDPCRGPLFQVQLSMVDPADDDWKLPGVAVTTGDAPPQPCKSDLSLDIVHHRDSYHLDLSYYADRYDAATAQALAEQVVAMLSAALANPSANMFEHDLSCAPGPPVQVPLLDLSETDVLSVPAGASSPQQRTLAATLGGTATIAVPDPDTAADPYNLIAWLDENNTTAVYLTPPLLRALSASLPRSLKLRIVFVTNDADFTAHDVERLQLFLPDCRVVGVCSDKSGTVPVALYEVPQNWVAADAPLRVPIGAPLEPTVIRGQGGTRAGIGEIARWDALGGVDVRLRPDGLLDFAAPLADQLETVAALLDVPGVQDAVVVQESGELVCYVGSSAYAVDVDRLLQHLVTRLPEYLIPSRFELRDRLPLTPEGRHDLVALMRTPTDPVGVSVRERS